jgi:hypothetical protein
LADFDSIFQIKPKPSFCPLFAVSQLAFSANVCVQISAVFVSTNVIYHFENIKTFNTKFVIKNGIFAGKTIEVYATNMENWT